MALAISMVYPKKSLGQNFLHSKKIIEDIVSAGNVGKEDIVLEIGPGKGILTEALLKTGARVIALEKDRRLIPVLQKKFFSEISFGKLQILYADILDFSPSFHKLQTNNYKLISNIPYYLTGRIFRKFLETEIQPSLMTLLVQKEVAQRIVAKGDLPPHLCHCHKHKRFSESERQNLRQLYEKGLEQRCGGKESLLSISVKAYGRPQYVKTVSAGNFYPVPKVDSAIILVENISKQFFDSLDEKFFFELLKKGFSAKRKKLAGNLKSFLGEKSKEIFASCAIEENARAENLNIENWKCLASALLKQIS